MNSNRRVLHLVLYSTGLLVLVSAVAILTGLDWYPLERVNLVSDVLSQPAEPLPADSVTIDTTTGPVLLAEKPAMDPRLYHQGRRINGFYADSAVPGLSRFDRKLYELKHGQKRKVRIAFFGDSMIEGDLLTQTLRELLQTEFGGYGVGFVPITSPVARFRQTAITNYSDTWMDDNFREGKNNRLYLSGHSFFSSNGWVQVLDQTRYDSATIVEKSLLCGYAGHPVSLLVNGRPVHLNPSSPVNRVPLLASSGHSVKLELGDPSLPVYGLSFESESGVIVDNFSFRGITGVEFGRVDSSFFRAINEANPYDLIVFQYGVNLLFRPNDKNFSWYARTMKPVLRKIRGAFQDADFLLVSTADRAFRYNGVYQSAIGIDSLVKVQAALAYETGSAFYNQFASMGGSNSIVDWAKQKPSLANQDYVHPNHRGARILATWFYEALLNDYNKYADSLRKTD